jgi:NitT/TauT family transport system substrate-binding protein
MWGAPEPFLSSGLINLRSMLRNKELPLVAPPRSGQPVTVAADRHSGRLSGGRVTGMQAAVVWSGMQGSASMRTRSFLALSLTGVMITILAAGCGSSGGAALTSAMPKPEEPDVTVAAIPAVDLAGLYIAQDRGLFARQGLHVKIVPVPSAQSIVTDQVAGKIDISAGSYVAYIAAEATGARFRILAEASTLSPDTRALVVTGNSRIADVTQLAGRRIGVNGVNSIGTLLVSALLAAHGISPSRVRFVTDPDGFPAMPGQLQRGAWGAAFLAEPYITAAGQQYGQQVLADLDQGAVLNLPVDGYVATQAWARAHPRTAAAFTRAIEQAQAIANGDASTVQAIMARDDKLPPEVTASMALPRYPVGPVTEAEIQRVARAMGQSGILGGEDATEAGQRALVESMTSTSS